MASRKKLVKSLDEATGSQLYPLVENIRLALDLARAEGRREKRDDVDSPKAKADALHAELKLISLEEKKTELDIRRGKLVTVSAVVAFVEDLATGIKGVLKASLNISDRELDGVMGNFETWVKGKLKKCFAASQRESKLQKNVAVGEGSLS